MLGHGLTEIKRRLPLPSSEGPRKEDVRKWKGSGGFLRRSHVVSWCRMGGPAPHGRYANAFTMAFKVALERIALDAFSGFGS
jgi:hypothetical protein